MTELSKKIKIQNQLGLHARASAKLVDLALDFVETDIIIKKENETANAKSIIAVMSLAANYGSDIEIICSGNHTEECLKALCQLIDSKFGEE